LLELLLVFVFSLHLIAVNIAAAGPFLCIALEWRATRRSDDFAGMIGRQLAGLCVVALVAGVAIGAALLWMLSIASPSYWSAIERVPAQRWWFAGGEMVFYLVCMIPYALLWDRAVNQRWWHRLLALLAATNLLYHFPPLFTMISLLSTRSELATASLDRALYLALFTDAGPHRSWSNPCAIARRPVPLAGVAPDCLRATGWRRAAGHVALRRRDCGDRILDAAAIGGLIRGRAPANGPCIGNFVLRRAAADERHSASSASRHGPRRR
jgi:hypothetical protein